MKLVDPQSVLEYFAVETWIDNKWDWPGKNWSMWKTAEVDEANPYADGSPDSVFCAKGAGYTVPWDQVARAAHCDSEAKARGL